ncbi:MAG: hypothetical protein JJT94_04170 [Bernardetiaceae bacterium]|nr:hypothetical protein [Bernardetiaceae bacterium]
MRNFLSALFLCVSASYFVAHDLQAQNMPQNLGQLSGGIQTEFAYYREDSLINAVQPPEKVGFNGYFNLNYELGNFRAGMRYEAYLPALLGYPTNLDGNGIPFRFVGYTFGDLDVTAGNFYEQFGNGLILRTQEERSIGIANSIDGVRLRYDLGNIARLKGIYGKQRDGFELSQGFVRGVDTEVNLSNVFASKDENGQTMPTSTSVTVGGSYVNRYQPYTGTLDYVNENVGSYAGRFKINSGGFSLDGEYVYREGDPSVVNQFINRTGSAMLVNALYSQKGFAATVSAKRIINMDYRTDRNAIDNVLLLNFIPANTKQHTYRLLTLYPYASQPLGEMGIQADIVYTIPKGSALGGKYGTTIMLNYATARNLDTLSLLDNRGYELRRDFGYGDRTFYQDFNIEVGRRWSKKLRQNFMYAYIEYDKDLIEGTTGFGLVKSHTVVLETIYKISPKKSIRNELQHLASEQDFGNWLFVLFEYSVAPKWSVFVSDEFNYVGINTSSTLPPLHYYNFGGSYIKNANRFSISYGRQRPGVICVGGICRLVPANSGLTFSVSSTF